MAISFLACSFSSNRRWHPSRERSGERAGSRTDKSFATAGRRGERGTGDDHGAGERRRTSENGEECTRNNMRRRTYYMLACAIHSSQAQKTSSEKTDASEKADDKALLIEV